MAGLLDSLARGQLTLNKYTLALASGSDAPRAWTFYVTPESVVDDFPSRTMIGHTLAGPFAEEYGRASGTITVSGTTGFRYRLGQDGVLDGTAQLLKMYELWRDYQTSKEVTTFAPAFNDYKAYWFDWDKGLHFWVVIDHFSIRKSADKPLIYHYDLRMRTLGKPSEADSAGDVLVDYFRQLNTSFQQIHERLGSAIDLLQGVASWADTAGMIWLEANTFAQDLNSLAAQVANVVNGFTDATGVDASLAASLASQAQQLWEQFRDNQPSDPEMKEDQAAVQEALRMAGTGCKLASRWSRQFYEPAPRPWGEPTEEEIAADPATIIQQYPARIQYVAHFHETIMDLAARFLGDADLWPVIAFANDLAPDQLETTDIGGRLLSIPARQDETIIPLNLLVTRTISTDDIYGTSLKLNADFDYVVDENGGLKTVSGLENLAQALRIALETGRGELAHHPLYGTHIREYIGGGRTLMTESALAAEVVRAMETEPRVSSVIGIPTLTINQDIIRIEVDVRPIASPNPMVFGYDLFIGGLVGGLV